jgi:hypothetical protein
MGTYAYIQKPFKIPKSEWDKWNITNCKEVRQSSRLYIVFKDFLIEREVITSKEDFAKKNGFTLMEIDEKYKFASQRNPDIQLPTFPLASTHYYLAYDEVSYMGKIECSIDWYDNLSFSVWTEKISIEQIFMMLPEGDKKQYFKTSILDVFIEGEHFLEFH